MEMKRDQCKRFSFAQVAQIWPGNDAKREHLVEEQIMSIKTKINSVITVEIKKFWRILFIDSVMS